MNAVSPESDTIDFRIRLKSTEPVTAVVNDFCSAYSSGRIKIFANYMADGPKLNISKPRERVWRVKLSGPNRGKRVRTLFFFCRRLASECI